MRQTTNYGLKITEGNDDWRNIFDDNAHNMDAIDAAIAPMTGATVSSDGTSGVVPEPETGDQNKFLKGDASWAIPGVMTVNGRSPDASGNITVIEGGGSSSYGSYRLDANIPVSAWTGSGPYVATVSNQYITANMDGTETWLDDETAMLGDTTFTTSDGLLTISTIVKPTAEWSLHVALAVNGADVLADISNIREDVEDNANAIVTLRNDISNTLGHGTAISASSSSALKTSLLALANTADVNGFIAVKIIPSFTSDGFTSGSTYGGHIYNIYKTNGSTTYFSAMVSNNLGEDVLIGYSNGTWHFNSAYKNFRSMAKYGQQTQSSSAVIEMSSGYIMSAENQPASSGIFSRLNFRVKKEDGTAFEGNGELIAKIKVSKWAPWDPVLYRVCIGSEEISSDGSTLSGSPVIAGIIRIDRSSKNIYFYKTHENVKEIDINIVYAIYVM